MGSPVSEGSNLTSLSYNPAVSSTHSWTTSPHSCSLVILCPPPHSHSCGVTLLFWKFLPLSLPVELAHLSLLFPGLDYGASGTKTNRFYLSAVSGQVPAAITREDPALLWAPGAPAPGLERSLGFTTDKQSLIQDLYLLASCQVQCLTGSRTLHVDARKHPGGFNFLPLILSPNFYSWNSVCRHKSWL